MKTIKDCSIGDVVEVDGSHYKVVDILSDGVILLPFYSAMSPEKIEEIVAKDNWRRSQKFLEKECDNGKTRNNNTD